MIKTKCSLSPVLYIPHGGGPLPLLGDQAHQEMIDSLQHVVTLFDKPAAIVVISAHWEAEKVMITSAASPSLIYDYDGFPKESYEVQYPAPGEPVLAHKIFDLLTSNRIEAELSEERGFDHGLFVPLKIMYPDADIPCVQISLLNALNPQEHIQMGRALAALREENILIVGSGLSFHNLPAFFSQSNPEAREMNEAFEAWLINTCSNPELNEQARALKLVAWESAPGARFSHPREEHLLPLHVCYGMAESPTKQVFTIELMGKRVSCYLW